MIHTSDNTQPQFPLEANYTEMETRFHLLSRIQRSWLSLRQRTQWYIHLGRLDQESKKPYPASVPCRVVVCEGQQEGSSEAFCWAKLLL
jgi:hypothetical protein